MTQETYHPYKKPNDKLLYIHSSSNHSPQIIKQLPNSISERLSKNSSNQEIFSTAKVEYEDALKKSGYNVDLNYTNNKSEKPKTRKRNIIWFNLPFTKSVSTNVAKRFLQLVTKHFPRSHKLRKLFNRSTVKVNYSCINNMSKIIKGHNKKVTSKPHDQRPKFSCRKKSECPMEGNCQVNNVVYKCDETKPLPKKVNLGLAEGEWKSRFYNHKLSFKPHRYSNKTTLSSYMWHLKSVSSKIPNLKWCVLRCATPYSNISKKCLLHFYEKLEIVTYQNQKELLNKGSELLCKCR